MSQKSITSFFGGQSNKKSIPTTSHSRPRKRKSGSSFGQCPLCNRSFPLHTLERHASSCGGQTEATTETSKSNVITTKLNYMAHDREPIPGLYIFDNFISEEEEAQILAELDGSSTTSAANDVPWKPANFNGPHYGKRWGVHCNLRDRKVSAPENPLPDFVRSILMPRLTRLRPMAGVRPNEANAIDYRRKLGHYLSSHVDDRQLSKEPIANLSISGDCFMTFVNQAPHRNTAAKSVRVWLPRRCLQVLTGRARYDFSHGIKNEDLCTDRRVSVTMRESPLTEALPTVPFKSATKERTEKTTKPQNHLVSSNFFALTVVVMVAMLSQYSHAQAASSSRSVAVQNHPTGSVAWRSNQNSLSQKGESEPTSYYRKSTTNKNRNLPSLSVPSKVDERHQRTLGDNKQDRNSIWEQPFLPGNAIQRRRQDPSSFFAKPLQCIWGFFVSSSRTSGTHDNSKEDLLFSNKPSNGTIEVNNNEEAVDPKPLPIAYRYFGRKFRRPTLAGSIPVVLFGPNADHWKVTAHHLQQQGFSVIACERVTKEENDKSRPLANDKELYQTMLRLLNSLRWQQAVLVACDDESLAAIQLAWQLAPDRIAGLILTGNLVEPTVIATRLVQSSIGIYGLDVFLIKNLPCPFLIVWNGDTTKPSSKLIGDMSLLESEISLIRENRKVILGGGTAPHRRKPEQVAWVITRFIEENLAQPPLVHSKSRQPMKDGNEEKYTQPHALDIMLSQEFFVILGRVFATGVAYGMILRVGIYQYKSFQSGIFDFQTKLQYILSTFAGIFQWFPWVVGSLFQSNEKEASYQTVPEDQEGNIANKMDTNDSVNNDLTDTDQTGTDEDSIQETEEEDPIAEDRIKHGPFFFLDKVVV